MRRVFTFVALVWALALVVVIAITGSATAQTSPGWSGPTAGQNGTVPTAGQWNAIFASKQDYLGAAPILQGVGPYKVPVRTAIATTDTLSGSDYFVCPLNTSTAATENLPSSPTLGLSYLIKDCGGLAGSHNITVSGNGNNIDGASTFVMNVAYQSAAFTWNGTQWSIN